MLGEIATAILFVLMAALAYTRMHHAEWTAGAIFCVAAAILFTMTRNRA